MLKLNRQRSSHWAKRKVKVLVDGKPGHLTYKLSFPLKSPNRKVFASQIEVTGMRQRLSRPVEGCDAFDVMKNALIYISSDLYLRSFGGVRVLDWEEQENGGFPQFPSLRLMETSPLGISITSNTERESNAGLDLLLREVCVDDLSYPFVGCLTEVYTMDAPQRGDVLEFHESAVDSEHMTVVVISPVQFNRFGWCIYLPLLSPKQSSRTHGYAVRASAPALESNVVLCHRPGAFSWVHTKFWWKSKVPDERVIECIHRLKTLLQT